MGRLIQRILIITENVVIVILSMGIVVTVFYGVLVRYLPISGEQMAWPQELAQLFLVWFAFFAIAMVQRKNAHFDYVFFVTRLRGNLRLAAITLIQVLSMSFLVFIAINSFYLIYHTMGDVSTILRFPMLLFPLALFISCCLMIAYTCSTLVRAFKKPGVKADG